jgi:hypothetical protein
LREAVEDPSNDNESIFAYFLTGYWNQMSPDLYADLGEALADFRATEGDARFGALRKELAVLADAGRFPSIKRIKDAYSDPFWSGYGRILTREELENCKASILKFAPRQ